MKNLDHNHNNQCCPKCNVEMYRNPKNQREFCCDWCNVTVPAEDVLNK
jgi:hypothetical protein